MTNLPNWLTQEQNYSPKKDKDSFINKSINALVKALSRLKNENGLTKAKEYNIPLRLFGIFAIIIMTSLSKNFSFVILMITLMLIKIAFMNSKNIRIWFNTILPVIIFSALILTPAIFLGSPKTMLTILGKIFVCASLVLTLNLTTGFNEITKGLKAFFVPDIIIFTLDLTIKYIIILGEACSQMLVALKTRSIGKNEQKSSSASAILGAIFIKARRSVDDISKAMECRGFNGKYVKSKDKFRLKKRDAFNILLFVFITTAFVYLEVII